MERDVDEPEEAPPYEDPPKVFGVHFLTCRSIWFDNRRPEMGFGLAGIYTNIEPPDGVPYPILVDRVFIYCQLWGDPGEYRLRVRLVKLDTEAEGEIVESHLGRQGEPREFLMPRGRPAVVSGIEYVDEIAFPIHSVPFREPGLYEYQLWADGIDEPIARERVMARE